MTEPLFTETPAAAALVAAAGTDLETGCPSSTLQDAEPTFPGDSVGAGPSVVRGTTGGPVLVVGLDLSLTQTGVATRHGAVSIRSSGTADATLAQRQQRLRHLQQRIVVAVSAHGDPDLIVIEGPSYGSTTPRTHDRSGLWWLLIDVFTARGWRVIEAAPSTRMKYATGKGRVDKDVVLTAAIKRLPIDVTNRDEADAAWLCAIGHDLLGQPLAQLPAEHRKALDIVRPRVTEDQ